MIHLTQVLIDVLAMMASLVHQHSRHVFAVNLTPVQHRTFSRKDTGYFVELYSTQQHPYIGMFLSESGWAGRIYRVHPAAPANDVDLQRFDADSITQLKSDGAARVFDLLVLSDVSGGYGLWQNMSHAFRPRIVLATFESERAVQAAPATAAPTIDDSLYGRRGSSWEAAGARLGYTIARAGCRHRPPCPSLVFVDARAVPLRRRPPRFD